MHLCFQPSFCFPLASFRLIFLDIARHARKRSNENKLNIKQKYRLNSNDRFGFKKTVLVRLFKTIYQVSETVYSIRNFSFSIETNIRFISTEPLLVSVCGVVCTLFRCSRWLMFVVRAGGMLRTQYVVALSAQ